MPTAELRLTGSEICIGYDECMTLPKPSIRALGALGVEQDTYVTIFVPSLH